MMDSSVTLEVHDRKLRDNMSVLGVQPYLQSDVFSQRPETQTRRNTGNVTLHIQILDCSALVSHI